MSTVHLANDKRFEAAGDVSILAAARSAGVVLEYSCATGRCGTCKARVVRGSTVSIGDDSGLHVDERRDGFVLTCTSAAASDLELDIEDVSELADIQVRTLPCRVDAIERVAPDVVQVRLRFPPNSALRYLAGQYVDVIGPGGTRRSYSIANAANASGKVDLQIREVEGGVLSGYWFSTCAANDLLRIEGPKGTFFLRDVAGLDLVLLATGTGIAPVKALLEDLAQRPAEARPRSTTLYWGGRVEKDHYWQPAVEGVELRFVPVLSRAGDAWTGRRGHVHLALLQDRPDLANAVIYACGSQAMIDSAHAASLAAGLPARKFFSDAFVSSS